jgi:nucleoside-diphosphate-sugar epimerase
MQTRSLLITGANGFVGRSLCARSANEGWKVRGAVRGPELLGGGAASICVGEINERTDWSEALPGVDVVIHLAARVHVMREDAADPLAEFRRVNVAGTEHLARAAAGHGAKRLVYVSSVKVNGEQTTGESKFKESDIPHPEDPYGISKWEAEQVLHRVAGETGLEVVIVRPPLVYGPAVKGNFAQMLAVVARGMPLPFASILNLRSLIYVENLADALIACASHPAATGQTYLVSDGEDISTPALLRRLAMEMGVSSHIFACPPALLRLAGKMTGKSRQIDRLLGSLQVDNGKICRELNWVPPYSLQQGLHATAEWYRNRQEHT